MKSRSVLAMILVVIMAFASFPAFVEEVEECKHVNKTVLDVVESTHFINGNILYKCPDCGKRWEEELPLTAHDYGTGKVIVAPTCEQEGKLEYTCQIKDCGETKPETIQNLGGHKYVEKHVDATCQEVGLTAMFCSVCGQIDEETVVEDENAELADHNWDKGEVTAEATCCAAGEIVYTCQTAGCEETMPEVIEKLECVYEEEGTIEDEATCSKKGTIKYYCICEDEDCKCEPKVEAVDTLPHTFVLDEEKSVEATCEKGGYDLYVCSVCSAEEKRNETEALGHTKKAVETVAPTCEKAGYTLYECEECDAVFADDMTAALGHKLVKVAEVKATCDKEGIVECWQCSVCEKYYDSDKEDAKEITNPVIAKDPHKNTIIVSRDATCGEVGYENVEMCEDCGAVISGNIIPALAHENANHFKADEATCTEDGKVEYWYCDACGKYFGSYNEKTGVYSKELIVDEKNKIDQTVAPALGHNVVTVAAIAATCEKDGTSEWSYCSREGCGEVLTAPKTVVFHDDKANQKEVIDVAATCTAPGSKHIECTVCGNQIGEKLSIDELDHDFVEVEKVEATCTEDGHEAYIACSMCKKLGVKDEETGEITIAQDAEIKVIPAEHKPEIVKGTEPTCTEKGLSDYSICSVCGIVTTEQIELDALGHTFEEDSTVCKVCGFDSEAPLADPHYTIAITSKDENGVSGTVVLDEGCEAAETLYVRVAVYYYGDDGEMYFIVMRDKVVDGTFDVGYQISNIARVIVVATDMANCASTPIGSVNNYGYVSAK